MKGGRWNLAGEIRRLETSRGLGRGVKGEPGCRETARHIELGGVVQGVGFRPFVYNLARERGLRGWVRNTSAGVEIEVAGPPDEVESFVSDLRMRAPPLARIDWIRVEQSLLDSHEGFRILESRDRLEAYQLLAPDHATCKDCLAELFDPRDRRHRYPFINCTNCGPRFTIIEDIPYDRPRTTMRDFRMCEACQAEYDDPTDRRFHAQPNACPACGPHLEWVEGPRQRTGLSPSHSLMGDSEILAAAGRSLRSGGILAVKGLGGFQLACDATDPGSVSTLRRRKRRPHKPLAVMMGSMEEIRRHCRVNAEEEQLLLSTSAPIVLLERRPESNLAAGVAPGQAWLGVMLPYTPLHHLLLQEAGRPLVMTSGNLSEEPIARDNEEALRRLSSIADAFLLHNRGIYARYDDSVWFVPLPGRPQPVRRARGYAPYPIRLSRSLGKVLACGAELKNTFCLTRDTYAFVSQHIGDMENLETLEHFEQSLKIYEHLFRCTPEAVACDLHPDFLCSRYARERAEKESLPLFQIQHHHAHIASCLADNDWPPERGQVLGVSLDGTGYGPDGTIWGGEFLVAGYDGFRRWGHLQYLPLPGGEAAIRKPVRLALACCQTLLGRVPDLAPFRTLSEEERRTVSRMLARGFNTPRTSSCGRLFDAVSALAGVCLEASFEGQAAMELESAACGLDWDGPCRVYPFSMARDRDRRVLCLEGLFQAMVEDLERGETVGQVSLAFHATVARMVEAMCERMREETGLATVALSGGCFQNRILLRLVVKGLAAAGFEVLLHRQVPCNDGGLSLGQAAIAAARRDKGEGGGSCV